MVLEVGEAGGGELIAWRQTVPYEQYLQHEHWLGRRLVAIGRAGHKCQLCGAQDRPLEVHHNSYSNLWCEPDEDLIVLCAPCHERNHGPELQATYTGLVCPNCATQWVVKVAIVREVTDNAHP